jgi:hypothetical protein
MIDPVNERAEHRGVAYTITGDYTAADKSHGRFIFECRWARGLAGDPETARAFVRRVIDDNLDAPSQAPPSPQLPDAPLFVRPPREGDRDR